MCDQLDPADAKKLVGIAEAPETGSNNDAVHEEATLLHEGVRRRHRTSTAPSGLVNRLSSELYGSEFQYHASSSSLRAADWQQMTLKGAELDKPSTGAPISREVSGVAGGVLFRAIVVDVLRHKIRGKVLALSADAPLYHNQLMLRFQRISLRFNVLLFRSLHILVTIVIWQHHFYLKYRLQEGKVPKAAPNYYWKLLVPPIEFGAMHAILFQLALIPLTVSKGFLAWISANTSGLPMQHMMTFHIHLGYTFCIVMVLSVILFFTFFGKVCTDFKNGDDKLDTCKKFTDEIMITGYCILFCTLVVLGTAYFRGRIAYELFYLPHLMTLVIYVLATVHTLDSEFRQGTVVGTNRSQSFKWFAGSIAIYTMDQIWRAYNTSRGSKVLSAKPSADGRTVLLHVARPRDFRFKPGQYASLNVPDFGVIWHPFSIGSDPEAVQLTFLIEVQASAPGQSKTWTEKLAAMAGDLQTIKLAGPFGSPVADADSNGNVIAIGTGTGIVPMLSLMEVRVRKLGLLGLGALVFTAREQAIQNEQLASKKGLKDPLIGLLKMPLLGLQSVLPGSPAPKRSRLFAKRKPTVMTPKVMTPTVMTTALPPIRPSIIDEDCQPTAVSRRMPLPSTAEDDRQHTEMVMKTLSAQKHMAFRELQLRWRLRQLNKQGNKSQYMLSLARAAELDAWYLLVDLLGLLVISTEVTIVGLTLSWANLEGANATLGKPATPTDGMTATLMWSTFSLVLIHTIGFFYRVYNPFYLETYTVNIDVLMIITMWIAQCLWMESGGFEMPSAIQQTSMAVFGLWRVLRYIQIRKPEPTSEATTALGAEEFTLIWVAKSADLIAGYLPELVLALEGLQASLYGGHPKAAMVGTREFKFLKIMIYCTDKDKQKVDRLKKCAAGNVLEKIISYDRPDLVKGLKHAMMNQINSIDATDNLDRGNRATQVTFCGAPPVGKALFHGVLEANTMAAHLGLSKFYFKFREEFYGYAGGKPRAAKATQISPA